MQTMEAQATMGATRRRPTLARPPAPALPGVLALATAAGVVPARAATAVHGARAAARGAGGTRGAAKPRLRLTRRGRVVVFALFLLLAATAVTLAATASRAADPSGPAVTTVVQQDDTLWSIAERHHLKGDRQAVIEEIRRLNGLDDYTVYVGQELKLPS
ncbi:LysM peptidoglycan-binding domain-containing protein [Phytohabitans sp. LJ34]|uniref:LysM peptidoglycan-binding domain-containing protein n=1 Tax=Phytohabitans sp. LJ34 TaxID=3452217 RepID=UPI003F8B40B1